MSKSRAIELALQHNPSLEAALLDLEQSSQNVTAEEGRFVPVFEADAGATHSEVPRLRTNGGVITSRSDTYSLGSQLGHKFPWGTQLTLRFDASRMKSRTQILPGSNQFVTLGPGYDVSGRLSLVQPLLRGAGRDYGEAALRQARLAKTAKQRAYDVAASQLLRDVLTAYWELWYQDRAVEIERAARDLAVRQREDAQRRLERGALAPVDLLSFETRVAQLNQSLATARAQRRQQAVTLGKLLGKDDLFADVATDEAVPSESYRVPSLDEAVEEAMKQSTEVLQAQSQVSVAQNQLTTAGQDQEPRLDLDAYVQSEGLASGQVPPSFGRFGTGQAVSAHVGLTFELPVTTTTRSAQHQAAQLGVDAAEARLKSTRQQIAAQIASALASVEAATERVELGQIAVEAAEKQVEAQRARYALGDAIAIEVQQAEDSLRQAQLSAQRARVDRISAILSLQHSTGMLLQRHSSAVAGRARRNSGSIDSSDFVGSPAARGVF